MYVCIYKYSTAKIAGIDCSCEQRLKLLTLYYTKYSLSQHMFNTSYNNKLIFNIILNIYLLRFVFMYINIINL